MKAIRYLEAGRAEWVDAPMPILKDGQVLLKVLAVATCPQWDLHLMAGESMAPGGTIQYPTPIGHPGHEAVGEVVQVGPGCEELAIGDRAALWRDQGPGRDGCYAEFVAADEANALRIPPDLPPDKIASLELAMCVEVSFGQIRNIGPIEGKRFGVSGLGPAGLVAVQLAHAYGAREIVAFDPIADRRSLALELGATHAWEPSQHEALLLEQNRDASLDFSIDCTGLPHSINTLMRRTNEIVALFGVLRETACFGFADWCKGLHLIGYGKQNREAATAALDLISSGKLDLSALISATLPMSDYPKGIELLQRKEAIKVCFIP